MARAITLEALRVLDAIDKKGSFAAAAEALFKVPSALSYTVQKLEEELGVVLFDRSRQRAEFTASGRLLLERGRELLRAANALEEAVHQLEAGWETRLRIAKDSILPLAPLLTAVHAFHQLDKPVAIDLREEVFGGTWDALLHERCDLALGAAGELPKGVFEFRLMGEVEFVFAVAPDHPLRWHNGPVDAAAIEAFPTIVVADSSLTTPARSAGLLASRHTVRVASLTAKIAAQRQGVGVGFLPLHLIRAELAAGQLVVLPCAIPRSRVPLFMAWRKGSRGNALMWFIEALAQAVWLEAG